jgi:spore maturation protein CgeB
VPLAFDPTFVHARIPSDEVVFIGARYPGRTAVLTELCARGVPVRAVGSDWSHRTLDRLRTWSWQRPEVPACPSVARGIGAGLMAGAAATINIHGDQDGFTMRTFEASGVGALQLIDRADVEMHYEPGVEILPFSSVAEIADLVARAGREPRWASRIRAAARARTLAEHTFAHRARALEDLWG